MANNKITFEIVSKYIGESFKRAKNDINDMNSGIRNGINESTKLASALGQMDTSCAKAMSAVGSMAQAILTFNVATIASNAAIIAFNAHAQKQIDAVNSLKEAADAAKASMEAAFSRGLDNSMAELSDKMKSIADDFEAVTARANSLVNAINGLNGAMNENGIVNIEIEKLNEMLSAATEEQRKDIEATYNHRIALQKLADVQDVWADKSKQAADAVSDNSERIKIAEKQLAAVTEKREQLEAVMVAAKESNDPHWRDLEKKVTDLKSKEVDLEKKMADLVNKGIGLETNLQKVQEEEKTAIAKANLEIKKAELAEKELNEAKDKRKYEELKKAETTEDAAKNEVKVTKNAEQLQKDIENAKRAVIDAEKKYAEELSKYRNSNNIIRDAAEALIGKGFRGGTLPVNVQGSISANIADQNVNDAIKSGIIETVKDANNARKQFERQVRDRVNKVSGQAKIEKEKYDRIINRAEDKRTKEEQWFVEKYDLIHKKREDDRQKLAEAKKDLDEARRKEEEFRDDIIGLVDEGGPIADKLDEIKDDLADAVTVK